MFSFRAEVLRHHVDIRAVAAKEVAHTGAKRDLDFLDAGKHPVTQLSIEDVERDDLFESGAVVKTALCFPVLVGGAEMVGVQAQPVVPDLLQPCRGKSRVPDSHSPVPEQGNLLVMGFVVFERSRGAGGHG